MDDVTRRQALKLTATAGAVAAGASALTGQAQAQDQKKGGHGNVVYGDPIQLGGQETYKLTSGRDRVEPGYYGDNCGDIKDELRQGFDCAEFGSCDDHYEPASADAYAFAYLVPKILAQGCVIDTEAGHRTVKHKNGPITYHTYLPYARGKRP